MLSLRSIVLGGLLLSAGARASPDDGPQYYTDSVVVSDGTTYTEQVVAASTPYYVSSTYSASTETFLSTSATTIYDTFTSLATYESASTTTSYPTCSGYITVTTTIVTTYAEFKTIGTSFVSAIVYETYYISGTSTSEEAFTSTTTYYVPGPPDEQTTTAPTDIHTAPFSLTFPCGTTTVTETISYEPQVVTQVQIRETVATTFSSSDSYFTESGTSYSTATYVSTELSAYPVTTSTASVQSSTTEIIIVITPQTLTSGSTYYGTTETASTQTYHITASIGGTTTILMGPTATETSTLVTVVSSSGSAPAPLSSVSGTASGTGTGTPPPSATGAGSKSLPLVSLSAVLAFTGMTIVVLL